MAYDRICFAASEAPEAQEALERLIARYGQSREPDCEVLVALGGDGFMLHTLHASMRMEHGPPVYGMNRGTVGFLMNDFDEDRLHERLAAAREVSINPLRMRARDALGRQTEALAINEVSLLRETRQAAKIQIRVNDELMLEELVGDGVMVATPAGSTAYNFSAHGPILPIKAKLMALTAVAAFRPRRWRGALLYWDHRIRFDVLEARKRPVSATADAVEVRDVVMVEVEVAREYEMRLLYNPGHGLEERIIREQFSP
ncbi:MAG: NAD kinase [Pikeienuella sp.]